MPTLKSVKSLCHSVLRGAPLTPRTRYRSPFPFTELFHRDYSALFIRFVSQPRSPQPSSVLVFSSVLRPRLLNHSPSSSPEPSSVLVSVTILHPRPRNCPSSSSPEPSFILVFSPVHRIRLRYRSPSSSPEPSSILVSGTVLHPRLRNCSPFSFSALFTGFVSGTVLRPVSVTVLHPRFQPFSPDSSPLPSSILVFIHPRFHPSQFFLM